MADNEPKQSDSASAMGGVCSPLGQLLRDAGDAQRAIERSALALNAFAASLACYRREAAEAFGPPVVMIGDLSELDAEALKRAIREAPAGVIVAGSISAPGGRWHEDDFRRPLSVGEAMETLGVGVNVGASPAALAAALTGNGTGEALPPVPDAIVPAGGTPEPEAVPVPQASDTEIAAADLRPALGSGGLLTTNTGRLPGGMRLLG